MIKVQVKKEKATFRKNGIWYCKDKSVRAMLTIVSDKVLGNIGPADGDPLVKIADKLKSMPTVTVLSVTPSPFRTDVKY